MTREKRTERRANHEVTRRFDDLVMKVSSTLIASPDPDIDLALKSILAEIGEHLDVDLVLLWEVYSVEMGVEFHALGSWAVPGLSLPPGVLTSDDFPWAADQILSGAVVMFSDLDELPEEAAVDRRSWEELGARANLSMPLEVSGHSVGALSLAFQRPERDWSDVPLERLRVVVDAIANALRRKSTHEELLSSEMRYRSFVKQSSDGTWCMEFEEPLPLDLTEDEAVERVYRQARMVEVNDAFARMYGFDDARQMGTWRLKEFLPRDSTTMDTLRAAISAGYKVADLESRETAVDGSERIFLNNLSGEIHDGKLLRIWGTQRDVTEQRDMERTIRSQLDELAYLARAAVLSEVTAALAHEMNQPLTAIHSNAQAARRFLRQESVDTGELGEILDDIISDNRRAAEVIRRSRALLKRKPAEPRALNPGDLVSEALNLIRNNALLMAVTLEFEATPEMPLVRVDRIQIQQVVLNLVQNAIEAMTDSPDRVLQVRVSVADAEMAEVSFCDSGPGVSDREIERIFDSFVSTKEHGLGMGLSISRSIVEAHGGRLWAMPNDGPGLTMRFTLPFVEATKLA